MHAFPHRTETNYPPWRRHFRGGLAGIERIHATTRFVPCSETRFLCPVCGLSSIDTANWFQVGEGVLSSTPVIKIGCRPCIFTRDFWSHDSDAGWLTTLQASFGRSQLPWIHFQEMNGAEPEVAIRFLLAND